jgi:hypothetical protein
MLLFLAEIAAFKVPVTLVLYLGVGRHVVCSLAVVACTHAIERTSVSTLHIICTYYNAISIAFV